jgi:hypothetical protein
MVIRYDISIYIFKRYVIFLSVVGYFCLHEIGFVRFFSSRGTLHVLSCMWMLP